MSAKIDNIIEELKNLTLFEASELVTQIEPKTLVEGKSREEAENVKKELAVTNAEVKIV